MDSNSEIESCFKRVDEIEIIIEKLNTTFDMIDQMNEMDLDHFEPLNNPLELTNISREDSEDDRNSKKDFLAESPKSDDNFFVVPKIVE